jgi:predicted dehydrogenase
MKQVTTRRQFLARSLAAGAGVIAAPAISTGGFLGAASPNERIVTGHIGVGGMGMGHLGGNKDKCGAICDVDENHLQGAAKSVGRYVPLYKDFRQLLDQKDVDAVFIASPDHWHAVMTVFACEAGKDVYVQKPSSVTLEEGRKMVEAAERCGRVVQVGSQGRSTPAAYRACTYIRNGRIGKVKEITCWHYANPVGGFKPDTDPPASLDWDLWLGPMRYVPYNEERCHFNFRWFLEFGGGQIRDRGAHVMSVAMWCMASDDKGPVSIEAEGTAPKKGIFDCPTDMEVKYEFKDPDWVMYWRQPGEPQMGAAYGAKYWGEKDTLIVTGGDGGCGTEQKANDYEPPASGVHPYKSPGHEEDFFNCIRTRQKPIMTIEAGHAVATLCILGNISYILGRKLHWDAKSEKVIGDAEANRMLRRPNRSPWLI